ncbi:hypothetical protein EZH22_20145 [Xanthobacter dioxanivorans]|uniref:DUF1835 domain-containing protein n=1 Tax=Xanthobacter dioxanivorans TaxID=2528964 RepID=A0A974SH60_9HYPH|nr:hypothetical protein [Xanthobacter dioxanivorans]QRG05380.1 hypothetical protein EZH22_20145 [Xanthobacter dioxanivorans]
MAKLIVTNGDSAVERLRAAGIFGHLLPWQDMLHDGPVPPGTILEEVSDVRADFLSDALGLPFDEVRADFAHRDAQIEVHSAYAQVELWFEHDLYDQLQLIQLLDYFAHEEERMGLFLVQASHYLGVMAPDEMRALEAHRAPVTHVQLEIAREAWEAFTAPTPRPLADFLARAHEMRGRGPLPHLLPALARLIAELPAPRSGLSLTEERILRRLADGPAKVAHVYAAVHSMDEAQFLADLPFFLRLDGLAFAHEPLIAGLPFRSSDAGSMRFAPGDDSAAAGSYRAYAAAEIRLTPAGAAALKGGFDHASANAVERSVGGTRVCPGAMWRYDRTRRALVAPN